VTRQGRRVLGVDPGASGALALLDEDTDTLVVCDMPTITVQRTGASSRKHHAISEAHLAQLVRELRPDVAWVERVHAMPRQGVSSSFAFGLAYGLIRGVLATLPVPVFLVTPTEWKKEFRIGADKQQARVLATQMFPLNAKEFSRIRDDGRAEAALLAVFGMRYPL
jgi:crossover junction endodeoxyribonuclease RuvC